MISWQGFWIGNIQRSTTDLVLVQSSNEGIGVDNRSPADIADVRLLLTQELELFPGNHPAGLLCQREGDYEQVQVRPQEGVQLVFAPEPFRGEFPLWIAESGLGEGVCLAGLGGCSFVQGVCVDIHAECLGDSGALSADAAVAKDAAYTMLVNVGPHVQ